MSNEERIVLLKQKLEIIETTWLEYQQNQLSIKGTAELALTLWDFPVIVYEILFAHYFKNSLKKFLKTDTYTEATILKKYIPALRHEKDSDIFYLHINGESKREQVVAQDTTHIASSAEPCKSIMWS